MNSSQFGTSSSSWFEKNFTQRKKSTTSRKKKQYWIGIDLGTTNSLVAVCYPDGEIALLPDPGADDDSHSADLIPSMVSFQGDEKPMCGHESKKYQRSDCRNTVYETKRFIGLTTDLIDKNKYTSFRDSLSYVLESDADNVPKIVVWRGDTQMRYEAWHIGEFLLRFMHDIANSALNAHGGAEEEMIAGVVITHPAYFRQSQISATRRAAEQAGFRRVELLQEPVAAGYFYAVANRDHAIFSDGNVSESELLILDHGGGTTDLAIIKVSINAESGITIDRTSFGGDSFFGGRDYDEDLIRHFNAQIVRETGTQNDVFDAANEDRDNQLKELRDTCILLKEKVCKAVERAGNEDQMLTQRLSTFYLNSSSQLYTLQLSYRQFERICERRIQHLRTLVEQFLRGAEKTAEDFDAVFLVGGSARIPAVRRLFHDIGFARENVILSKRDADTAVAKGAAIFAAKEFDKQDTGYQEELNNRFGPTIVTKKVGINIGLSCINPMNPSQQHDIAVPIFDANRTYPCEEFKPFESDYTNAHVVVVEKISDLAAQCRQICAYRVHSMDADRAYWLRFSLNADRVLSIEAWDLERRRMLSRFLMENSLAANNDDDDEDI